EIVLAREHGEGSAIRQNPTLHVRMIYFARRYAGPTNDVAVVRLAVPLTSIDGAVARYRHLIVVATAIAITAAIAISILGTYLITRPIRDLTKLALAMSEGDLDVRASAEGGDEAARLARALNRLAAELSRTIHELRGERDLLAGVLDGMGEGVLLLDAEGS